jgi:nitronate monooxygenase
VYQRRHRLCDLGFLREPYLREDGTIGYRCPAEPPSSYLAKGGKEEDLADRKCLCNALVANVGMPQRLRDGTDEPCLVTMGDDATDISRFCTAEHPDFSAADVIRVLLGG